MAANADIQNGDRLVTSGIDGTYPAGLPVAVMRIERDAEYAFARVVCRPGRGRRPRPSSARALGRGSRPPRPEEAQSAKERTRRARRCACTICGRARAAAEILQPVRLSTIVGSFALALFLNFCCRCGYLRLRPDFVALVLIFWVRVPAAPVGLVAWTLGLVDRRRQRRAVRTACARVLRCSRSWRLLSPPHPVVRPAPAGAACRRNARRRASGVLLVRSPRATTFPGWYSRASSAPLCGRRVQPDGRRCGRGGSLTAAARRFSARRSRPCAGRGAAELRDHQKELQQFQLRWRLRRAGAGGFLHPAGARFFFLQVVQHDYYHAQAEDNRISIVPILPNRGLILDRNGVVLAHNYRPTRSRSTPPRGDRRGD